MLPEAGDVGRALSLEEESALLRECGQSRSRSLLPFVILALDTGARYNTIRTLQWRDVDFSNRCIRFGKDKTAAGTGRLVPLNRRAMEALKFWAEEFPQRKPEHYVFPAEKVGASGDVFRAKAYATDPSNPIGTIKEAWEGAKRRTRRQCPRCKIGALADRPQPEDGYVCVECNAETEDLPAGLIAIRFHDLRRTAVSRMIAAGTPLPIIARIVGWSAGTMAKMAARYGHFGIEDLRGAVEAIGRNPVETVKARTGSLEFSLDSDSATGDGRAN